MLTARVAVVVTGAVVVCYATIYYNDFVVAGGWEEGDSNVVVCDFDGGGGAPFW